MKKILIFTSILLIFLLLMTLITPVVKSQQLNNSYYKELIEIFENEDFHSLKELLNQVTSSIEQNFISFLRINNLLEKLEKTDFKDEKDYPKARTNILLLAIGIICIIFGVFTSYFGSGRSRAVGAILLFTGIFLVFISV